MNSLEKLFLTSITIYAYFIKKELLFIFIFLIILYTIIELIISIKFSNNTLKSKFFNQTLMKPEIQSPMLI